jgi:Uncharacterized conserved protein
MHLSLTLLPERYAICRFAPDAGTPDWAVGSFVSVTRTGKELSVVCPAASVPPSVAACTDTGWHVFEVAGPLDFSQVGILASLCTPLAEANVPLFAVSTFDTDYLLVQETSLEAAVDALTAAGHQVHNPPRL